MKRWMETSWLCGKLSYLTFFFMNLYRGSICEEVIEAIKRIWVHSHFGKMNSAYEEKEPLFLSSKCCVRVKKIIHFGLEKIGQILDWICKKVFKTKDFPCTMSNGQVRFRLTGIGICIVLSLALLFSNIEIMLLGVSVIVCIWIFACHYETATYLLAIYAFIDYVLRKYVVNISSIWDELFFVAMICVWLYKGVRYRNEENCKQAPLNMCLWVFIGIYTILLLFSPNLSISLEGFRAIIQYMLWYFIVLQLLKDKRSVRTILLVFIGVVGVMALHGVYQFIVGVEMPEAWVESSESVRTRVYSILSSPNIFGSLNVLAFPICFSFAVIAKQVREKLFFIMLTLCMLASLAFTYSRGAWIGAVCAIGVYVLLKNRKLIVPTIIVGVLVLIFVPSIRNRFLFMFSMDYLSSSMKGGRLIRWLTALDILKEHPLTGLGLGQFGGAVAMNNELTTIVKGQEISTYYMDNYYLKIAVEAGIIGLIVFVWLMYQVIAISFKTIGVTRDVKMKELEMGILAGLSGVICHNFVENVFEVPLMTTMFWMLAAVMMQMWYMNYTEERKISNVEN